MRTIALALTLAFSGALSAGPAAAQDRSFTFVALGDVPYDVPEDYERFERLIGAINALDPVFSIHVGDTKSGSDDCGDDRLQETLDRFMLFERPLVYTPGDNEWTDCHRPRAGGYDPLERLARVREMHFSAAESLGRNPMPVVRQADVSDHGQMVENARWVHENVLFVTVHVVGSNNGFERNLASAEEYFARNAANLDWIAEAFTIAGRDDRSAIVFAFQANPLFEERHFGESGFVETIAAFRDGALAFGRPVLLLQGDFHELVIDQPLTDLNQQRIETVYRLQVMGASEVQAVAVTVDPDDAGVFAFRPLIVPENVTIP